MRLLSLCEWLEATPVGVMVRESLYGFPILVAIHIMGLTLSVGLVVWFDLRLLGLNATRVPVSVFYRRLMPWSIAGFTVMFVSGGMLLAGFATSAYTNVYFRFKILAILAAGANAVIYHRMTERRISEWDTLARPPRAARLAGLTSIVLWTLVIMAGRMVAYTLYSH